ncbi:hypothetical protein AC578_6748 [Pseudocercospora eumusae]|nr:hypothetical protein AC578_6748 [Pseudocercospora eumusae]
MLFNNFFFVAVASLVVAKPFATNPKEASKAASILGAVLMPRYKCGNTCDTSSDCTFPCANCIYYSEGSEEHIVKQCGH